MSNNHIESDIALLLMQLESDMGDSNEIYLQIHDIFEEMRADGDHIPTEFMMLEQELNQRFAA